MTKKCINCGTEIDDNALFCINCGTMQDRQEPTGEKINLNKTNEQVSQEEPTYNQGYSQGYNPNYNQGYNANYNQTSQYQYGNYPMGQQQYTRAYNSVLGIASLVLGILAIFTLGCIVIPEIIGLIFGIIALNDKNHKHGVAIAGTVLSAVSLCLFIFFMVVGIIYS